MAQSDTPRSSSPPHTEPALQQPTDAVAMDDITTKAATPAQETPTEAGPSVPAPAPAKDTELPESSDATPAGGETPPKGKDKDDAASPAPVEKQREGDSLSIGPSDPEPGTSATDPLVCTITLLLPTGARHPYKIDEKYLAKRNVEVPDVTDAGRKDPFSISVYKLKELILREWREEWEGKPASPSSIRLIFFGKLLDDKEQLKKYQFSADSPNIVHMSVRPADMMEEDEAGKGKTSSRDGRSREGGGGCCVIL